MIVLLTSSRDWPAKEATQIYARLNQRLTASFLAGEEFWLMHGDCKTGGDAIAHEWFQKYTMGALRPWVLELRRPALWRVPCRPACLPDHRKKMWGEDGTPFWGCPSQGPIRNRAMIREALALAEKHSMPLICEGFIKDASAGASGTCDAAEAAGIETHRWRASA